MATCEVILWHGNREGTINYQSVIYYDYRIALDTFNNGPGVVWMPTTYSVAPVVGDFPDFEQYAGQQIVVVYRWTAVGTAHSQSLWKEQANQSYFTTSKVTLPIAYYVADGTAWSQYRLITTNSTISAMNLPSSESDAKTSNFKVTQKLSTLTRPYVGNITPTGDPDTD